MQAGERLVLYLRCQDWYDMMPALQFSKRMGNLLYMHLKGLLNRKIKDNAGFNAQAGDRFYRCMDCNYVWIGPCPSPCKKCRGTNVTQCSEIFYENYVKRHQQDAKTE